MNNKIIKKPLYPKLKETAIESKVLKLHEMKPGADYDYLSTLWTGMLLEDFMYISEKIIKKSNRFAYTFTLLRITTMIKHLQEEKKFTNQDIIDIFKSAKISKKVYEKILKEAAVFAKMEDEN